MRRVVLGTFGTLTVDEARKEAKEALRDLEKGLDPVKVREARLAAEKAAKREAELARLRVFEVVLDDYLTARVRGRLTSAKDIEAILRRRFEPSFIGRDIATITRAEVQKIIRGITAEGFPSAANKALRAVRPLFAYAFTEELIPSNPAAKIKTGADDVDRERVLTDDELLEIWMAAAEVAYPFGAMVQLLMLTGQRRVEVAGMEWGELNRDEGIWTIPASRTKNKKTHIVHLTPQALAVINRLPVLSDTYVLTTTGTAAISGFSKAKLRLDEELLAARRKQDPDAKGLEDWQYHDLRRTLATGLASMGVAQAIIEKILNHNPKALHGVAGIYNRHEYLPDRKAALEAWGRRVESVVGAGGADNVIQLRMV